MKQLRNFATEYLYIFPIIFIMYTDYLPKED
jgi:hypothetical protein